MELLKKCLLPFFLLVSLSISIKLFSSGTYHPPSYRYGKTNYSIEEIKADPKGYFQSRFEKIGLSFLKTMYRDRNTNEIIFDFKKHIDNSYYQLKKLNLDRYKALMVSSRKLSHSLLGITNYKVESIKEDCRAKFQLCLKVVISYHDIKSVKKEILEYHFFDKHKFTFMKVTRPYQISQGRDELFTMMAGLRNMKKEFGL